jgi:hypothetical protein
VGCGLTTVRASDCDRKTSNHVWSYDFVEDWTHNGRKIRMLKVIDEFTRECIAIRVERKRKAVDVIDVLSDLSIPRGIPTHIRSRCSTR